DPLCQNSKNLCRNHRFDAQGRMSKVKSMLQRLVKHRYTPPDYHQTKIAVLIYLLCA
ncbi:hypothetical protein BCR42DRAFT_429565, partial [Absidia repens]